MATFEVTTDTDSITITWTDEDVRSVDGSFTIELDYKEKYSGSSAPTSPYRLTGLTAGTRYIIVIQFSTTYGGTNTPVAERITTSM